MTKSDATTLTAIELYKLSIVNGSNNSTIEECATHSVLNANILIKELEKSGITFDVPFDISSLEKFGVKVNGD